MVIERLKKEKPYLEIVMVIAVLAVICFALFMSGQSLTIGNEKNDEIIENMTFEDLPIEVKWKINSIKSNPKHFRISNWELDSKNKQIIIYVYDVKDVKEINKISGVKISNWTFSVKRDVNYKDEIDIAHEYFLELQKDPELQISGMGMSSTEVTMWVYNFTPENKALDGAVILNRTIHVYTSPKSPNRSE